MSRRIVIVAALAAGACLSPREDTSAFFLLSPTPTRISAITPIDVAVGLGPIEIPAYLDRAQMVVRLSDNQVTLSDSDRWAEPFATNLHRAFQLNLETLLPGASFVDYPWYAAEAPDYGVAVTFRRFEADASGTVVLDAAWRVTSSGTLFEARTTHVEEPAEGVEREAAVAAQSRALTRLAEEVAASVRRAASNR